MNRLFKKILLLIIMMNLSADDFKKYEMDCDNNLSSSCRERAYLALEVNKSYDEAEKYFLKACELKDAKSCELLGYLYRSKNANERDQKKYFKFFYKACQLGNPNACTVVGSIYSSKKSSNSTQENMIKIRIEDLIQATKYYQKACMLGDQRGCRRLGRDYLLGYGRQKDRQRGIKFLKENCRLTSDSCNLYIGVIGVNQKYEDLNISEFELLNKNCKLDNHNACNKLGFLSLDVYQDYTKAENNFTKACQLEDQESCKMLGFIYKNQDIGKRDFKKSFNYFNKACELGDGYACSYIAIMYVRGEGINKDVVKSTLAYQKSCNLGNNRGCTFLGDRYRLGKGVKVDQIKAVQFYRQACNNGEHYGCMKYIGFSAQP